MSESMENTADTTSNQALDAYQRGELHHSNRRFQPASKEFAQAHELDPENDRYLFKLAAAYHNTGDYQLSVDKYSLLIERLRRKPFKEHLLLALAYKGGNLAILGDFSSAESLINEALEMDSVSPIALAMKGLWRLKQGQLQKALEQFKLAHEIDPTNNIVKALRAEALEKLA